MSLASQQYGRMQSDVDQLRSSNQVLRVEIERLSSDPRAIEAAARARLNMVRANEIVVPVEWAIRERSSSEGPFPCPMPASSLLESHVSRVPTKPARLWLPLQPRTLLLNRL